MAGKRIGIGLVGEKGVPEAREDLGVGHVAPARGQSGTEILAAGMSMIVTEVPIETEGTETETGIEMEITGGDAAEDSQEITGTTAE